MSATRLTLCAVLLAACGAGRPTADAGAFERTARAREVLTFDGSLSRGTIDLYSWDFGDGSAGEEGKVVTHAFAIDGNFSVTLTVIGPGGRHSTSVAVNVGGGCNATATIIVATNSPQPGAPVVLNGSTSKGCNNASIVQYDWDFGDGTTDSGDATKANVTHTWATLGIYSVALTVKDANAAEGKATRSLGIGVAVTNPTVTCPATLSAVSGVATSFSASATDPGGKAIASYAWTFSEGGTAMGASVQHTYAAPGSFSAQVVATTVDSRSSDPCNIAVTVSAPANFTGSWLLNPGGGTLTGCQNFSSTFPAATLAIVQTGNSITATPSGNGWPAGQTVTGTEDPPPAAPGNFTLRATLPNEAKGGCGTEVPDHSLVMTFNAAASPMSVAGTWRVVYTLTPACTMASCLPCNCVASQTFSGIKQ